MSTTHRTEDTMTQLDAATRLVTAHADFEDLLARCRRGGVPTLQTERAPSLATMADDTLARLAAGRLLADALEGRGYRVERRALGY